MSRRALQAVSRWDDVRILLAVLRSGSFTKAAKTLGTEQSTISRRIAALEEELTVPLFERGARAPVPTDAALGLRAIAENIEAEMSRLSDLARGGRNQPVQGRVRLALTEEMALYFALPRLLPRLRREHPRLSVDLITSYQAADLMGHEADIALRFFKSTRGDLVGKRLGTVSTGILCSKDEYRTLEGLPLHELDWITVSLPGLPALETKWLGKLIDKPPALSCSSYHVQIEAIRAGLGVGVGPALLAHGDPDFALLEYPGLELPRLSLFSFTRRAIRAQPRITAVLRIIEEELSSFLSAPGLNDPEGE